MECSYESCKRIFLSIPKLCQNCTKVKYCSPECREQDWPSHSKICLAVSFSLSDFQVSKSHKTLGKGAYGEVQLVQHISSKIQYALKVIKKRSISRSSSLKMIQREIDVQKRLIHRNIIRLFGHIDDIENLYLVLEYAEKGNLFHYIRRKRKLSEEESWFFFVQVCAGVHYLHEKNITHRDLKPENVLLDGRNIVKICDFGWCAEGNTERSTYCGTLDYMAPEILKGYHYTNKVDIWALGILLYEMTHGYPPFNAKSDSEKSRLIRLGTFRFSEEISAECRDLIQSILQETPESRPGVLEVLTHPWVTKILKVQSKIKIDPSLEPGKEISDKDFGNGIIVNQHGLVCEVSFPAGNKIVLLTEYSAKERNNSPAGPDPDRNREEKEFEDKLSKNYPVSYKSSAGSRGRPPRPGKVSLLLSTANLKNSLGVEVGFDSPTEKKRGESNKVALEKNSVESNGSGFSSNSDYSEGTNVNTQVMAQRLKELEKLQKQIEGPASVSVKNENKKKGFFSKIGGMFGL